jgi:hypothetical protein
MASKRRPCGQPRLPSDMRELRQRRIGRGTHITIVGQCRAALHGAGGWPLTCRALVELSAGARVICGVSCGGKNKQAANPPYDPGLFSEDANDFIGYTKFTANAEHYSIASEYANVRKGGKMKPRGSKRCKRITNSVGIVWVEGQLIG